MSALHNKATDLMLNLLCILVCNACYWSIQLLSESAALDIELLITTIVLVFTSLILIWNALCSTAAWFLILNLLPHTIATFSHAMIQRWGTTHSRTLLQRYFVQTSTTLLIASSASACTFPSIATTTYDLPQPQTTTTPISAHHTQEAALPHPHTDLTTNLPVPITHLTAPPSAHTTKHYTIQAGDTLWSIASENLPHAHAWEITQATENLYLANKDVIGENPDLIYPGITLTIPTNDKENQ